MKKTLTGVMFLALAILATTTFVMAQPPGGGGDRGQGGPDGRGPDGRGPGGPGGPGGGPGGMMMGGGGAFGVLMNEDAQKELGLTDEQKTKLREAGEKLRESMRPPGGSQDGRPDGRQGGRQDGRQGGRQGDGAPQDGRGPGGRPQFDPAQMQQFRERMEKMQKESRTAIEGILDKTQIEKLDVMVFQRSGGLDGMFIDTNNLRALNLTEDQAKKIAELQQAAFANRPQGMENMSREEMRDMFEKAREKMKADILSVLTDEQKAKAEAIMKETPDYLKQPNRGPRGEDGDRRDFGNWEPGQGGGGGRNAKGEARSERRGGGRSFPGSE